MKQFQSPIHYRESLASQQIRLKQELEDVSIQHAVRIGKQGLKRLQDRRFGGNTFDALTAEIIIQSELKLEGVAAEYIPAVTDLVLGQYLRS